MENKKKPFSQVIPVKEYFHIMLLPSNKFVVMKQKKGKSDSVEAIAEEVLLSEVFNILYEHLELED